MPRFTSPSADDHHAPPPTHSSRTKFTQPTDLDDDAPITIRLTPAVTAYLATSSVQSADDDQYYETIESLFSQLESREQQRIQAIQDSFRTTQASLQREDLALHSKQVESRDAQLDGIKRAHEQARAANEAAAQQAKAAAQAAAAQAAAAQAAAAQAAAAQAAAAPPTPPAPTPAAAAQQPQPPVASLPLTPAQRQLKKRLTLYVQQISATQEQVANRTQAILTLLAQTPTPADRALASSLLADRLIAQAEAQVVRLNSFAFPLAMVAVAIACYHEQFSNVLVDKLRAKCELIDGGAEDKSARHSSDDDEHYERVRGYFLFYGAYCSVEAPGHPHGLDRAWRWLAQTLNGGRFTQRGVVVAIEAMLSVAGYRLGRAYGRQWTKLMHFVQRVVVPGCGDAIALRGVRTRLQVYVEQHGWQQVPQGAVLPVADDSSYERA